MRVRLLSVMTLVLFVFSSTGCDAIGSEIEITAPGSEATTEAPDPTEAPPNTEAPDPTEAPPATDAPSDDDNSSNESLLLFFGLALLAILLVGVLIGRGRRGSQPVAVPAAVSAPQKPGFKDYVRDGYSEARWLLDAFGDDLAIWRGNALFEGATSADNSAGTALAATWEQLDQRMSQATDALYRAEAAAPDSNSSHTVRAVIDALNTTRSAVDARAEARFSTRQAESQFDVAEASDRERLASTTLAENKQLLDDALVALGALA